MTDRSRKRHKERQRGAETDRDGDRQKETVAENTSHRSETWSPRYNLLFPLASQTPARRASRGHLENKKL